MIVEIVVMYLFKWACIVIIVIRMIVVVVNCSDCNDYSDCNDLVIAENAVTVVIVVIH